VQPFRVDFSIRFGVLAMVVITTVGHAYVYVWEGMVWEGMFDMCARARFLWFVSFS
jgi:hypothetical protein